MNRLHEDCRAFRSQLERALEGRARPSELAPLGWHEHLLGCNACRELFAREEALEELLEALPAPHLSRERRAALLACLRADAHRDAALDDLLASDAALPAPQGLAGRVLDGIRESRLDELLDLDRELAVPEHLATHVLRGLRAEREPARRFVFDRRWAWPAAAAAAALLFFAWPREEAPVQPTFVEGPTPGTPADAPLDPDGLNSAEVATNDAAGAEQDELLAVLDLLEDDALWSEENIDLELAAGLDIHDEWLLEYKLFEEAQAAESEPETEGEDS